MAILEIKNLTKTYHPKKAEPVVALKDINLQINSTGMVFLLGKSGSGKSTLLNVIGGLDKFDSGEIIIKGKSSSTFTQADFDSYRNTYIGFVFQEYNILEEFTVSKNIALALELQGKKADKATVDELLNQVDLLEFGKRKPNELSGGQKQRVAIARALIKSPEIIMADEPTGALDSNTGKQVMETLKKLSENKLVIVVSHDREAAEVYGDRIIELKDGQIISDMTKEQIEAAKASKNVSIVGKKVLHVKKGKKLTPADMKAIKEYIENSTDADTFISMDRQANSAICKATKISESGKGETFRKTTEKDIEKKQYEDQKLIRSHLGFGDAFKMGASALKSKKIRLVFTIFLSMIAFALFGLIDTFASFNRGQSMYDTMVSSGFDQVCIERIRVKQVNKLVEKFPQYAFLPTQQSRIENIPDSFRGESVNRWCSISAVPTAEQAQKLKLQPVVGRFPIAENEIAISRWVCDKIFKCGFSDEQQLQGNAYSDVLNKVIKMEVGHAYSSDTFMYEYSIVGVIDPNMDTKKYENMELHGPFYSELEHLEMFGLLNTCYVSSTNFAEATDKINSNASFYINLRVSEEEYTSMSTSDLMDKNTFQTSFLESGVAPPQIHLISGKTTIGLGEMVIPLGDAKRMLKLSNVSDVTTVLDKLSSQNTVVTLTANNNIIEEFTIVGVYDSEDTSYENRPVIVNDQDAITFAANSKRYDYLQTRFLPNSTMNHNLVIFCETPQEGYTPYRLWNPISNDLDNAENLINQLSSIFLYVGIAFAVFAGLMMANFIATSISYKSREIGVLRAIGARGRDVFLIFFFESLILSVINWILACVATAVACVVINGLLISEFNIVILSFGFRQMALILGICVVVALIASFLPVYKVSKKLPIDAINNR